MPAPQASVSASIAHEIAKVAKVLRLVLLQPRLHDEQPPRQHQRFLRGCTSAALSPWRKAPAHSLIKSKRANEITRASRCDQQQHNVRSPGNASIVVNVRTGPQRRAICSVWRFAGTLISQADRTGDLASPIEPNSALESAIQPMAAECFSQGLVG